MSNHLTAENGKHRIFVAMAVIAAAIALCFAVSASMPHDAYALSAKNKAAHKAFGTAMSKLRCQEDIANALNRRYDDPVLHYSYYDMDGDGVDELLVDTRADYLGTYVYKYYQGKAVKSLKMQGPTVSVTYPKTKTVVYGYSKRGVGTTTYAKWSKGKLKTVAQAVTTSQVSPVDGSLSDVTTYTVKGKTVSAAKYKSAIKKLKKGKKVKVYGSTKKAFWPASTAAKTKSFIKVYFKVKHISDSVKSVDVFGHTSGYYYLMVHTKKGNAYRVEGSGAVAMMY